MKPLAAFVVLAVAVWAGPAAAEEHMEEYGVANLRIAKAWAPATPGMVHAAAVYLTLQNMGGRNDRLIGATSPIAERAVLHSTVSKDDVEHMVPIATVEVRAGKPVVLRPGGTHIMLFGLKRVLRQGSTFPVTLYFAVAGSVDIRVFVEGIGSMGPSDTPGGDQGPNRY